MTSTEVRCRAREAPADGSAAVTAHVITICVARSDDPSDAYYWRCSCGSRGRLMIDARVARYGGARHIAAMERGKR